MKALHRRTIYKPAIILITLTLCVLLISEYYYFVDTNNLVSRLLFLGVGVSLIFLPYVAVMLSETAGWINCADKDPKQIAVHKMLLIRIATDTLQQSLPGGAVYAELVRPYLLKKHLNFEYPESISANVITKLNILIAQILFLIFGLLIFVAYFTDNLTSSGFFSERSFYLSGIIFTSITLLLAYLLYKKHLLFRIVHMMEKTNFKPVRKLFNKAHNNILEIDSIVSDFFLNHKTKLLLTISLFFFTWIFMALESLIILKVMGINASIFQMIMIESIISIVRITFFFLPGALGPQDLSIMILFNLAGLPDPLDNAALFVLLKRLKELVWIIIGYTLLMLLGIKANELIMRKRKIGFAVNQSIATKY